MPKLDFSEAKRIVEAAKAAGVIQVPASVESKKETAKPATWSRKRIRKIKCRWCGFIKPRRGACPSCGKKSNKWSAKRARAGVV
jgi:rubrerythrin